MILKHLRKKRNLTTTDVAARLGISQGYYSQLENGKRSFSEIQLSQLAAFLQVPERSLHSIALSVTEDFALSSHWVCNIPINGIPLKAFLLQSELPLSESVQQFKESLISFIQKSVEKELSMEFNSNPPLLFYLYERAKNSINTK
jgi:transcriptional regulator with XRE-family HTH domain